METVAGLFRGGSVAGAVLVLSLVASAGLALGSLRVKGVSLGIAGVLFAGILLGHFGLTVDPQVMEFVREFGLILFVYTIGLQVGPGFVASLRRQGLPLNLMAAGVVLVGTLLAAALGALARLPTPAVVGLLSGATTNTPSLAAAQQALKDAPGFTEQAARLPGLAYAVAYPFGIVGIILTMLLVRLVFRINAEREAEALQRLHEAQEPQARIGRIHLQVRNDNLEGTRIRDVPMVAESGVVISRVLHEGQVRTGHPDMPLHVGDVILAVGPQSRLDEFRVLVGVESPIDLTGLESSITARRLVVTRRERVGKTVDELGYHERYGVVITRVSRAGVEFTPRPGIRLQYGDSVLAVGAPEALDRVAEELGNSVRRLNLPEVIPVFVGIGVGVLLGSLPFRLPGVPAPVRLGLAGGPLLVAIVLSHVGRVGPLIWYLPTSANVMLRELGIVLFLASVGLRSGDRFVETLAAGSGLLWVGLGAAITLVPLLGMAVVARALLRTNYLTLCGLLAGSMTDPPALAFAGSLTGSEAPSVAYATVYPLTMILRVLAAQAVVLLLRQ